MRKKFFLICLTFICVSGVFGISVSAQEGSAIHREKFYKAEVVKIFESGQKNENGFTRKYQIIDVKILDGDMAGETVGIEHGKVVYLEENQLVKVGQIVVLVRVPGPENQLDYQIIDSYRLDKLWTIVGLFFVLVIVLSGWRGVGSIGGLLLGLFVIIRFIVPQILSGRDPLFVSIVGSIFIMIVSIYLSHGFSVRTSISLLSTAVTLTVTGVLSMLFVELVSLTGLGTDEALTLQFGQTAHINFKGLYLGGVIIGSLGALDDITTGLTASVFELIKANPRLKFSHLFSSGMTVGREHISSMVNTLALAYAGSALPLFLFAILNPNNYPVWSILNSEMIAEEVVRTIGGSIGLVMAVPLTAFLSAAYLSRRNQ